MDHSHNLPRSIKEKTFENQSPIMVNESDGRKPMNYSNRKVNKEILLP